ncbi:MAG: hypothetical protein JW841_07295 [Deltaproteobacteria bacterium]|nr:hypothetical protein [Deltaproteobacteria bacterium]
MFVIWVLKLQVHEMLTILKIGLIVTIFIGNINMVYASPRLSIGKKFGCIIKEGQVICFGDHGYSVTPKNSSVYIPKLSNVKQISVGRDHACAITNKKRVWCWGDTDYGFLGDNKDRKNEQRQIPVAVWKINNAVSIACGDSFSCALHQNGEVSCWGLGIGGILGTEKRYSIKPIKIKGLKNIKKIVAADQFACAIDQTKKAYCWGTNKSDLFAIPNSRSYQRYYKPVKILLEDLSQLAFGEEHACALKTNGGIWCWGENVYGQVGVETPKTIIKPFRLDNLKASFITLGFAHTCILQKDGRAACWGLNDHGELSQDENSFEHSVKPIMIENEQAIVDITAVEEFTCILQEDSNIKCWGKVDRLLVDNQARQKNNKLNINIAHAAKVKTINNGKKIFFSSKDPTSDVASNLSNIQVGNGVGGIKGYPVKGAISTVSLEMHCQTNAKKVKIGEELSLAVLNLPEDVLVQIGETKAKILQKKLKQLVVIVPPPKFGVGKKKIILSLPDRIVMCGEIIITE